MLRILGWLNGVFITFKIFLGIFIGILFAYKGRKRNVKLLYYFAIAFFCSAIVVLPYFYDFINILLWDINSDPYYLGIWSFVVAGPYLVILIYVGIDLLLKKKKWYILSIYIILTGVYIILFTFNTHSILIIEYPLSWGVPLGEDLISIRLPFDSPQFYIFIILFATLLIFNTLGCFIKSRLTKDLLLRKTYLLISLAFFFFFLTEAIEVFLTPVLLKFITRPLFSVLSALLVYLALVPKRFEPYKQKPPKKEKLTIFISYATNDADRYSIRELAARLENFEEIEKVLFYEDESYDNILKYMNESIGNCDALLLFCSENALTSKFVEKEWTAADALNKPIIPIFYDSKFIPPILSSRLGVNYDLYNIEGNLQKIRNIVNKKCLDDIKR
ncbi:MAG: TIR domain-containing protein [Promethearchaeota archaeon]